MKLFILTLIHETEDAWATSLTQSTNSKLGGRGILNRSINPHLAKTENFKSIILNSLITVKL